MTSSWGLWEVMPLTKHFAGLSSSSLVTAVTILGLPTVWYSWSHNPHLENGRLGGMFCHILPDLKISAPSHLCWRLTSNGPPIGISEAFTLSDKEKTITWSGKREERRGAVIAGEGATKDQVSSSEWLMDPMGIELHLVCNRRWAVGHMKLTSTFQPFPPTISINACWMRSEDLAVQREQ